MFHTGCLATPQRTSAVPLVIGILALWVNGFCAAAEQDEAEVTEEIIVAATAFRGGSRKSAARSKSLPASR